MTKSDLTAVFISLTVLIESQDFSVESDDETLHLGHSLNVKNGLYSQDRCTFFHSSYIRTQLCLSSSMQHVSLCCRNDGFLLKTLRVQNKPKLSLTSIKSQHSFLLKKEVKLFVRKFLVKVLWTFITTVL